MRNVRDMRGAEKGNPDFCLGQESRPASRQTQKNWAEAQTHSISKGMNL